MASYEYSRWDGSQLVEVDLEELMAALADHVVQQSDVLGALQQLMRCGVESRFQGIDDLLKQLQSRRHELLTRYNLDSLLEPYLSPEERSPGSEVLRQRYPQEKQTEDDDILIRALQRMTRRSSRRSPFPDGGDGGGGLPTDMSAGGEQGLSDFTGVVEAMRLSGSDVSFPEMVLAVDELLKLERLKRQLEKVHPGADFNVIVDDQTIDLLGEEARNSWEQLKRLTSALEEAGYLHNQGDFLDLTAKGIRKIGEKALKDIFARMRGDSEGKRDALFKAVAGDLAGDTKKYQFGDDFYLHLEQTLMNSLARKAELPLRLEPEDFEVFRVHRLNQCATVLMLDQSCSMPLRGNFLAAKKVALALDTLIRRRYPQDKLYIVGFSDYAQELKRESLYRLTWNGRVYGTNMHHAFMLSRRLLSRNKGHIRQIIMITDGEPTAHIEEDHACFTYPPDMTTTEKTLREVVNCSREGIIINTFMLDMSPYPVDFVNRLTRINKGRAFFADASELGEYVLVDYISGRGKGLPRGAKNS